jgi:hypothetical protein
MSKKKATTKKHKSASSSTKTKDSPKVVEAELVENVSTQSPSFATADLESSSDTSSLGDSDSSSNGWVIFGIFILLIILLIAGLFGYQKFQEQKQYDEVDFYYLYTQTQNGVETENNFKYGNFIFVNMTGFWQTILIESRAYENYTEQREVFLSTHYNPVEVESIPLDVNAVLAIRNSSVVYMTYPANLNQDYVLAGVEVGKVLGTKNGILNKPVVQAAYGNYSGTFPVIDCVNATSGRVVIKFIENNMTRVSTKDNCVLVEGNTSIDVIKSADRLLFTLLGVMKP